METLASTSISPPHAAIHLEATSTSSNSNVFTGYTPELYHASDDDAEMSDGGVQIGISTAQTEQLNNDMDMVDAEVMGPYNVAVITANTAFQAGLLQNDDASVHSAEYALGEDTAESSYGIAGDDEVGAEDDDDGFVLQAALILDPMSVVSQQLQSLQDGQEDDDLPPSAMLHGSDQHHMDDAHTLDLRSFLDAWIRWSTNQKSNSRKKRKKEGVPNIAYLDLLSDELPVETCRSDLHGDASDFQGLDWTKIEVERKEARRMRLRTYKNYTNTKIPVWHGLHLRRSVIEDGENYFAFRRMNFRPKINLSHFQLRNLLACTSRNNICYAGESKVYSINPLFDQKTVRMDLTDPVVQPANPVIFSGIQISTIAADHNVLMAGGFCGEYGMIALDSPLNADHTEGLITTDINPITNHVQIHLNRHSGQPQASFASNDTGIRTLDCTTNKIVAHHKYDYAVNCSAISSDHRLRVIVGDNRNVMICDAEKGDVLQDLSSHMDFGFACAWADDGWHVATGNQDKLIKIWDARMWTDNQGVGKPVENIACTITGARSLRYSPLGSGKRVLVAAEAADMVSIIDAETYKSKQSFDFFGEISGVDFTPDGQTLFIGITDSIRGGIMELEKCGSGGFYGLKDPYDQTHGHKDETHGMRIDERASGLDWKETDTEVVDDPRSRRTATYRQRKAAQSWNMGPF